MAKMKVWYDEKGDYLELSLSRNKGFFKEIGNDIWERVDEKGNIIGFAILNFKKRMSKKQHEIELPLTFSLSPARI